MRLLGLDIRRAPSTKAVPVGASAVASSRGLWSRILEASAGAWQRNEEWTTDGVLQHSAVFACVSLIASDVGKLRFKLVEKQPSGIWREVESAAFSPVLRRPNRYQNAIQFKEWWITSKLLQGNTYVLKERDQRGVVVALYLLDPTRVTALVAPDGSVYYRLNADNLSGLQQAVTVPASEIIHDRMNCLFHPLVGVSPIFASGAAANIGLKIQGNSVVFFGKGSNPSGILTAPESIDEPTAKRLAEEWNVSFSGQNSGKVAVLGNGLTFTPMRMTAVDSQTIEHLKWSAETVCATFHVPAFKVGIGAAPTYQNAEILNQIYYSDCLQSHIESMEAALDEGLGLTTPKDGKVLGIELDLDALLRMDTATLMKTLAEGVSGAILTPDEARHRMDLPPLPGGNTVYMQQQNYSLAALDARDRNDPFAKPTPPAAPPVPEPAPAVDEKRAQLAERAKALTERMAA